jgi:SAM-dependent methyltransferase
LRRRGGDRAARQRFPDAQIVAIDITPRVGRLFRGDPARVRFSQRTVQEVAAEQPGAFDLVLLCDVVHHVPDALRAGIFAAIGDALAPGGRFFFKDWARSTRPIHWLCHAGDRWLTGDRVHYLDRRDAQALVADGLPEATVLDEAWVRPWRNNFAMLIQG